MDETRKHFIFLVLLKNLYTRIHSTPIFDIFSSNYTCIPFLAPTWRDFYSVLKSLRRQRSGINTINIPHLTQDTTLKPQNNRDKHDL